MSQNWRWKSLSVCLLFSAWPLGASGICVLDRPLRAGSFRSLRTVHTIVLHHTAIDSVGGSIARLRQRGLSYHYLVAPDGRVIEGVPPSRSALHAAGANRTSIGISLVGGAMGNWTPTEAQVTATRQLVGRLARAHPGIRYLVGHGDVRDSNRGEPFGVNFGVLLDALAAREKVRLLHPGFGEEPLRGFRQSALRLQARPLTPKSRVAVADLPSVERVTCAGERVEFSVPDTFRGLEPGTPVRTEAEGH